MRPLGWIGGGVIVGVMALTATGCGNPSSDTPLTAITTVETTAITTTDTTVGTTDAASSVPTSVPLTTASDTETTESTQTTETTETSVTIETAVTTEPTRPADSQADAVATAVEDLATATGRAPADITVALSETVTWRDGSLGCPKSDRAYTQALVDGYRIELVVDDISYWYHGASGGEPFLCVNPVEPADGGSGDR